MREHYMANWRFNLNKVFLRERDRKIHQVLYRLRKKSDQKAFKIGLKVTKETWFGWREKIPRPRITFKTNQTMFIQDKCSINKPFQRKYIAFWYQMLEALLARIDLRKSSKNIFRRFSNLVSSSYYCLLISWSIVFCSWTFGFCPLHPGTYGEIKTE